MGALRAAAIGLSLLAFAGIALPLPTRARTVVVLIDASDSIGKAGIEASRAAALSLIRALEPRDRAAAMSFAGGTSTIAAPMEIARAAAMLESADLAAPRPEATDVSAALAAAERLAEEGPGQARVCLFSDGRANEGGEAEARGAARVATDAVPAGAARLGIAAEGLSTPSLAHAGERLSMTWSLRSDEARRIEYRVLVDGALAFRGSAALEPGRNEIPLALDAGPAGRHSVIAQLVSQGGSAEPGEIRSGAYLDVEGEAEVLVASGSGGASPIARALEAQGSRVAAGGPESLPADPAGFSRLAAVVLDDMPALSLTEAQQSSLQDYVAGGGGLLVVGGESSLGRGEYYATPLEDMLPVSTDSRRRLLFTRAKLLFVIDHSGSMSEAVGPLTKQQAAMRGVAAAISELAPMDEVGIIGFDSSPTWVLPFTPAGQKAKIIEALSHLGDGGGTDLSAAIDETIRGFGAPGPTKRHAIILTDGLTPDADFDGLAARLGAAGASASTIAIGDEVNEELLKGLAERCGGSYYRASAELIPSIIDKETVKMTRELIQEGRIETRVSAAGPIVEGLDRGAGLPALGGYLLTEPKPLATVSLQAKGPDSESWDPLLASWRYGNGRVAVFASDSGRRWLAAWSGTEPYNLLWSQSLRSVERASPTGSLKATASTSGGGIRVVVEAIGPDRRSLSSLRLAGRARGEGGSATAFDFRETAPGRYEGFAPLGDEGLASIEVIDPVSGASASTWAWRAPGGESSATGPDLAALSLIASSRGGSLLSPSGLEPAKVRTSWTKLRLALPCLVLALLSFVAELFLRSTMAGQLGRARSALAAWWSGQRALAEASRAARPWLEQTRASSDAEDRRFMEMQRRLAMHVSRRYTEKEKADD
jgi:Ca-activated chloride channel homolog